MSCNKDVHWGRGGGGEGGGGEGGGGTDHHMYCSLKYGTGLGNIYMYAVHRNDQHY